MLDRSAHTLDLPKMGWQGQVESGKLSVGWGTMCSQKHLRGSAHHAVPITQHPSAGGGAAAVAGGHRRQLLGGPGRARWHGLRRGGGARGAARARQRRRGRGQRAFVLFFVFILFFFIVFRCGWGCESEAEQ